MPLQLYIATTEGRKRACVLSYEGLRLLEPVFAAFRKKTGVRMSEYDDTKVAPAHAALLSDSIDAVFGGSKPADIAALQALLRKASASGCYLYFEGE